MSKKEQQEEKPAEIIDDIAEICDQIQKAYLDQAVRFGEEKERYEIIRPAWSAIYQAQSSQSTQSPTYTSGVNSLLATRDQFRSYLFYLNSQESKIGSIIETTDTTTLVTDTTALLVGAVGYQLPPEITLPRTNRYAYTMEQMRRRDQSLCDSYAAIREALYGTLADPIRNALYMMRQSYDHLFSILAPDEDVRESPYWLEKKDEEKEKVTRRERLTYAAHTHISDSLMRQRFIANTTHILDVYGDLQRAHKRGELDENVAKKALREMQMIIEDWVGVVDMESLGRD